MYYQKGEQCRKINCSPQFLPILSHLHVSFVYFYQTGEQIQKIIRSPQFLPILSHKIMFFFKKVNRYKKLSVHRFFPYSKPCTGLGERGEQLFTYENIFFMGKNGYKMVTAHHLNIGFLHSLKSSLFTCSPYF